MIKKVKVWFWTILNIAKLIKSITLLYDKLSNEITQSTEAVMAHIESDLKILREDFGHSIEKKQEELTEVFRILNELTNRVQHLDEPFKYKEGDKVIVGDITGYVTSAKRVFKAENLADFSEYKDVYTLKTTNNQKVEVEL